MDDTSPVPHQRARLGHRPEVDGLRALAVLPVILFHAQFSWFRGGYIGVDVFFVISGYLITSIIVGDRERGKFTIAGFYERRARRIIPALSLVLLVCLPFAWLWLMPDQLKDFAESLVAVMLFSSNMLFWRRSGYFDPAAEERPLLHTWSLGVEEQYYILFPLLILVAWRLGLRRILWLLVALALGSLLLSEWGWRAAPTANFFLAPSRAWEILVGSTLAIALIEYPTLWRKRTLNEFLAAIGLLMILAATFLYDELTPFPSVYALLPTLGTLLVLAFATSGTLVCRLLSHKWLVGIGLISYSAYLWHQPLFAFARVRSFNQPPRSLLAALSVATIGLAYFSWRYVESPFRDRKKVPRNVIFALSTVSMGFFIVLGVFGHMKDGFRAYQRERAIASGFLVLDVEAEVKHRKQVLAENEAGFRAPFASNATTRILLVGDSHSNDVALAYVTNRTAFDARYQLRRIEMDETCFDKSQASAATQTCVAARTALFKSGLLDSADYILLVVRWAADDVQRIAPLKAEVGANGAKLVVVGRTAEFCDVPSLLARAVKTNGGESVVELERTLARYRVTSIDGINQALKAEAERLGMRYLDKKDLICQGDRCAFLDEGRQPYYFDYGHWSLVGARHFGERMVTTNWLPAARAGT